MVNKINLKKHFDKIRDNYLGKSFTHRRVLENIDDMGQVIYREFTDMNKIGIISPVSLKTVTEAPGSWMMSDLVLYMTDDSIVGDDEFDHVVYDGIEYKCRIIKKAFDDTEEAVRKYRLRKVAA